MNARISTSLFAVAIALAALATPGTGQAATVGYYGNCYGPVSTTAAIMSAGHTPVPVAAINAGTLATLDALTYDDCSYVANAAIDTAVSNGMVLIVHDQAVSGRSLPGASNLVQTFDPGAAIDLPVASPIISGPGGTLSNASLDGGNSSNHGYTTLTSLPADSTVLNTTADPTQVVTFSYGHGAGRVVYSTTPLKYYFNGGGNPVVRANMTNVYAPNLIAWAVGPQFTSCAAEGYRGAKLTLCRQVCEIEQSPSRLTSLIKFYMAAFRSEPPCAR